MIPGGRIGIVINPAIAVFATLLLIPVSASSSSAVTSYLLLLSDQPNEKSFDWTGPVSATVGPATQNWNRPAAENWGVGNRSGTAPIVDLYSNTDPGFVPPNGQEYPIEVEFGDVSVTPRSPGTKNVRIYTDFGPDYIRTGAVDRGEVHIRSTLQTIGAKEEGATLWLGWSEYFTHLDTGRATTILQFRNQPTVKVLQQRGFTLAEIASLTADDVFTGGPASGITTIGVNGEAFYHFATRDGTTLGWSPGPSHTTVWPIETGRWYDFVVQMKYSQAGDGRYRVWVYDVASHPTGVYSVSDVPEWDHTGATMYQYPTGYSLPIPSPQLRWGVYRHDAAKLSSIPQSERYMEKHLGPVRMWVGDDDSGFDEVKPN